MYIRATRFLQNLSEFFEGIQFLPVPTDICYFFCEARVVLMSRKIPSNIDKYQYR